MRITSLFSLNAIALDVAASNQDEIIDKVVELQSTHNNILDKEAYKKALYAREEEGSTYVDNGIRPMLIYPLGGILIMGAVMCGINPVMGMINTAMTDWLNALGGTSKVLLGAIVAGMMSVDMGGPCNKAAYVFGTAALASGNYEVMAAVMVGGMVPPLAIALSTTFCPKKWTPDERRNGIVNYVMGLCFVTEGAIPYAASDPLRVLPSCVIGAALAGALSMTFGCALRAPHGGIFVFPVVDHALMYVVALAAGSIVGAVILSLLKKTRTE